MQRHVVGHTKDMCCLTLCPYERTLHGVHPQNVSLQIRVLLIGDELLALAVHDFEIVAKVSSGLCCSRADLYIGASDEVFWLAPMGASNGVIH